MLKWLMNQRLEFKDLKLKKKLNWCLILFNCRCYFLERVAHDWK